MLKTLLRVRVAALLAAFTGQSRKRKSQTKGKAAGYAFLMPVSYTHLTLPTN